MTNVVNLDKTTETSTTNPTLESVLSVLLSYALTLPAVKQQIVKALKSEMEEVAEEAVNQIEAEDISGLDEVISSQLEDFEVEADKVSGLDDAIESVVDERLENFEVEAEHLSGLEQQIDGQIDEKLERFEVEADKISGLDKVIASLIESANEEVVQAITNKVTEEISRRLGA
jgi:hypothetical protein